MSAGPAQNWGLSVTVKSRACSSWGWAVAMVCCQLELRSRGHIWPHGWRGPVHR